VFIALVDGNGFLT